MKSYTRPLPIMKKISYILISFFILSSCSESQNANKTINKGINSEANTPSEILKISDTLNNNLSHWLNYYIERRTDFSLTDFNLLKQDSLELLPGNVFGNYDKNFDTIYSKFLVFSKDEKRYIDIDSYNWSWDIDEKDNPQFLADQEINLVNIKTKKVNRIAYRATPSQWVENAFWDNDSTIILLENDYEKRPRITKINLKSKTIEAYSYHDTLNFITEYSEFRLKEKGIVF